MKIALVYDRVNKWGGAERVLLALHEIWPKAPLYTAVYDPKRAAWAKVFKVHSSFMQHIPLAKNHHELFPWLTPMAFESFSFDGFDVVLSVTSAEAKDIITKPGTVHICYCLTPTRYLWSGREEYEGAGFAGRVLHRFAPTLRTWDLVAASRPDHYLAISNYVADRIKKYYRRTAEKIIYPPVDTERFVQNGTGDYFLCVARLVPYKRVDVLIKACNKTGDNLIIVGSGSQQSYLKSIAKKNITFAGDLTDKELAAYYQKARAFVFAGEEDFGIVSLEAQACGKPVICPRRSGMSETVIEGVTGELFDTDLIDTLQTFAKKRYDNDSCRHNAEKFSVARFKKDMKETVERLAKQTI